MSLSRRAANAMLALAVLAMGGLACWRTLGTSPSAWPADLTTAGSALDALRGGNRRFVHSARVLSTDTGRDAEYRQETAKAQHPFVVVLCCADSRVCPEFIFDQRAGCIFEIRNAGNVVDEDVLASFEYAVEHLHVPLLVVLAHKGCGAIEAVCEAGAEPLHDHLQELQNHMAGIHQQVLESHGEITPDLLTRLSTENARLQALALVRDSHILRAAVQSGQTRLVCGLYDMESGAVAFFSPR